MDTLYTLALWTLVFVACVVTVYLVRAYLRGWLLRKGVIAYQPQDFIDHPPAHPMVEAPTPFSPQEVIINQERHDLAELARFVSVLVQRRAVTVSEAFSLADELQTELKRRRDAFEAHAKMLGIKPCMGCGQYHGDDHHGH